MLRTILHLDLDAFYCSVEELLNPDLVGKPFAVGGTPDQRGVVASCSYAARRLGVRSAMAMGQALRLCPQLIIVPVNFSAYHEYSAKVMALLHNLTPYVEQISVDEAFIDVTILKKDGELIARQLQAEILQVCQLPCSLGVASNKLMAKIANNMGKSIQMNGNTPCAIEVIPVGGEQAYLAPLKVTELWGIGAKTAEKLHQLGIYTIGDITRFDMQRLRYYFGKHGEEMWERAHGRDNREVETESETKSVSSETTFSKDVQNKEELTRSIRQQAEVVGRRLRKEELMGTTIKLKLRWSDFTTIMRQVTLNTPTNQDSVIAENALKLFDQTWTGRAVRLLGVSVSHFDHPARQLSLFDEPTQQPNRALEKTLDDLQERFGSHVIRRASDIKRDES
jgi:DNA polymerase IV